MSIASEIQRVQGAIADAYDAAEAKGATMPETENIAALADCIESIPSGGNAEPEPKDVDFVDYDGTRIATYTFAEIANLSAMPTPPSHDGLVFDQWTATLEQIKSNPQYYCVVGALYNTADGKSHLFVQTEKANDIVALSFLSGISSTIEWGDGTSEAATTAPTHTYATAGYYDIKISNLNKPISITDSKTKKYVREFWRSKTAASYINTMQCCANLRAISMSASTAHISPQIDVFGYCGSLRAIIGTYSQQFGGHRTILCSGVRYFVAQVQASVNLANGCINLTKCSYSINGVPSTNSFASCSQLKSIYLPTAHTTIQAGLFAYCGNLSNVYIPNTSVPTLANVSAFSYVPTSCVFHIKAGMLASYQAATNWSTLTASYNFVEDL